MDVGSGNGIPAIIWAICEPELSIVLVEKKAKKIAFLNFVIGVLKINNRVSTINDDVRNIKSKKFDLITSRGFSNCEKFLEYTELLAKVNTSWLIMTTNTISKTLSKKRLKKLNVKITHNESVVINKKTTNKQILSFKKVTKEI